MSDQTPTPAQPESSGTSAGPRGGIRYAWPPPGLEAIQGAFWKATAFLGLGSTILVLPLLLSVAREEPFYSLGPLGEAWWILAFSSLLGFLVLVSGLVDLFRFFRSGWKAGRHGIPLSTLLRVAADRDRDMGFLLQGARAYQNLSEGAIGRVAGARVVGSVLTLASSLWPSLGFFLGVILGARGLIGPVGLTFLTLAPTAVLMVGGLFARALEGTELRSVYRSRRKDPWKVEEVQESARGWVTTALGGGEEGARTPRLMLGAGLVVLLVALLALPTFSLTLTSSVGPVLAMVATPRFGATQERAAEAEVYRRFRLPADSSISPQKAGEALQVLTTLGGRRDQELMLPPVREYEGPVIPEGTQEALGIETHFWPAQLFGKLAEGMTAEEEAALARIATQPVLEELRVLARAPALDVLGSRYRIPFPEGTTPVSIPIPRFGDVREVGYAMVARAAHQLLRGDAEGAETTLREVISAGFLLGHEGTTLIDNLIGFVMVRNGGEALEGLYRATGRVEEADALARAKATTERAVEMAGSTRAREDIEAALAKMPGIVQSPEAIRGLRWEFFLLLNGLTPCLNAHKVVFGPDEDFREFLAEARESLVRYPSESAYFGLLQGGWFGYASDDGQGQLIGKVVGFTLGGTETPGSCTALLASIQW